MKNKILAVGLAVAAVLIAVPASAGTNLDRSPSPGVALIPVVTPTYVAAPVKPVISHKTKPKAPKVVKAPAAPKPVTTKTYETKEITSFELYTYTHNGWTCFDIGTAPHQFRHFYQCLRPIS